MDRPGGVGMDRVQLTAHSAGQVVRQPQKPGVSLFAGDAADDRGHAFGVERSDGAGRHHDHRAASVPHERAGDAAEQGGAYGGLTARGDDDELGVFPVGDGH
jgi:hypothetical protein